MKKERILSLLALAVVVMLGTFVASCGGDDDNGGSDVTAQQLVGKWIETKQVVNDNGEKDEENYSGSSRYIILKESGQGLISPYDLFEAQICRHSSSYEWSVSKGKLTINDDGKTTVFTISGYSDNYLELTWKDDGITEITSFKRAVE